MIIEFDVKYHYLAGQYLNLGTYVKLVNMFGIRDCFIEVDVEPFDDAIGINFIGDTGSRWIYYDGLMFCSEGVGRLFCFVPDTIYYKKI